MLELSRFQRLEAEREGSESYLRETRERGKKKIEELDNFGMAHSGYRANEKSYLDDGIRYLEKEERKTVEKIKKLEEQLAKESKPAEKDEPIEVAMDKVGRLGVIRDLASIGLSMEDISEMVEEYNALLEGGGVPPAIDEKEDEEGFKKADSIKIIGKGRDRELMQEAAEEAKRHEMEMEEEQREIEGEFSKNTPIEEGSIEVESLEDGQDEVARMEDVSESIDGMDGIGVIGECTEIPAAEECSSDAGLALSDECMELIEDMEMEVSDGALQ